MKKLAIAAGALVASASAAFAGCTTTGPVLPGGTACDVPEISALEGTAALAALAAIVLITWERRRRAA
ncbi:MAG: hypothetical protein AAF479_08380 [Pseudomonadota bacterium]